MFRNAYLISIIITTIFGWASWGVVVKKLSPFTSPELALSLFYSSLFIALTGSFALLIYYLKAWRSKEQPYSVQMNIAIRQGLLISAMISAALVFQRLKVLTWWDGLLLLFIILLIEFYFMSRD